MKIVDQSSKLIIDDTNYDIALKEDRHDSLYVISAVPVYGAQSELVLAIYPEKHQAERVFENMIGNMALDTKVFSIKKREMGIL